MGAHFVEDAIDSVYDSFISDIKEDIENTLIEQGYDYEKDEEE